MEYIIFKIEVDTDYDFNLVYQLPKNCDYKISKEETIIDIELKFHINNKNNLSDIIYAIINFMDKLFIETNKQYLKDTFNERKQSYIKYLLENKSLFSDTEWFGGNQSLSLTVSKFEEIIYDTVNNIL